jgi:formylglycine-generating enzyme required for sulfatase activity/very-short-patch-repair endonuclease
MLKRYPIAIAGVPTSVTPHDLRRIYARNLFLAGIPTEVIRDLILHNLPLAARCAASPEINVDPDLKREIQIALIERTQNMEADLRARIAAGLALGELGDPRFERKTGAHGDYLLPPMVDIPAGTYSIGDDNSQYDFEKPQHAVELQAFQIGQFPVTNAEYALFIEAGGYEDEQWWDTDEALAWLRGEGSTDGQKEGWRDNKKTLEGWTEDFIRGLVNQGRITSKQADGWITIRNWTQERFEEWLDEQFPAGKIYRLPAYWDDTRFNNPNQPVVGVTWYEARAYCAWISANALTLNPSPSGRGTFDNGLLPFSLREKGLGDEGSIEQFRERANEAMLHIARDLRQRQTNAEEILWECLRDRRLDNLKFRRQHPVANTTYVVDFFCYQHKLVIEVDGSIHENQQEQDAQRQHELETLGLQVLRFPNEAVFTQLESVLTQILQAVTFPFALREKGLGDEGKGVRVFELPTEVQWEAAARGTRGWIYPYGKDFDVTQGNTFESHIRRTTPIGIYGGTPEKIFDLSGNVYDWTLSLDDQEQFPYPYQADDGRENISPNSRRVLRGGSWSFDDYDARAVCRVPRQLQSVRS